MVSFGRNSIMYCYFCATEILDGDSYCRNCGEESAAIPVAVQNGSWISSLGSFLLGAILYVLVLFFVVSLLDTLLHGTPQLAILILLVFGALVSGACMVLLRKLRAKPVRKRVRAKEKKSAEISDTPLLDLPRERFIRVPDSVTDSTTSKLKVR